MKTESMADRHHIKTKGQLAADPHALSEAPVMIFQLRRESCVRTHSSMSFNLLYRPRQTQQLLSKTHCHQSTAVRHMTCHVTGTDQCGYSASHGRFLFECSPTWRDSSGMFKQCCVEVGTDRLMTPTLTASDQIVKPATKIEAQQMAVLSNNIALMRNWHCLTRSVNCGWWCSCASLMWW